MCIYDYEEEQEDHMIKKIKRGMANPESVEKRKMQIFTTIYVPKKYGAVSKSEVRAITWKLLFGS